jgi:hypothetical protein
MKTIQQRPTIARGSKALYLTGTLRRLGIPETLLWPHPRVTRSGSFWIRRINHLAVLELARHLYRVKIKSVHPDKPRGSTAQALELNSLWRKIRTAFARFGHTLE